MCCGGRKLTRDEKSARRFKEYFYSLLSGIAASIVVLGLSAAALVKAPHNAAMIWNLVLVRLDDYQSVALPA